MKRQEELVKQRLEELGGCPAEIRIGTRGSQLAVAQAMEVKNRLLGAFPKLHQDQIQIVKIETTGDKIQDRHLAEIGGKGLFTMEIEAALFEGSIDMAVHSMKDMPDTLPEGLIIPCTLEREDPRDALLSRENHTIATLPEGAVVGTSSLRRQSQILRARPDLNIVPFRGNIVTRKRKLDEGEVDACLLAVAGVNRIAAEEWISEEIDTDIMLPAVAQGAIGVEMCEKNEHIKVVLDHINHLPTFRCITMERAYLKELEGSCQTPIAGLAEYEDDGLIRFRGLIASPDGTEVHTVETRCSDDELEEAGIAMGKEMKAKAKTVIAECA